MARTEQPETVQIDGRRLRVSNLTKVLYPQTGTTKAEVLAYLAEIAPVMIPHAAGRPATRKRWPDGVGTDSEPGQFFFIKDLEPSAPSWVVRGDIEHSGGPKTYPIADDAATLAWLGQVAALEIHVPQWRFGSDGRRRNPDRIVLDLDPGPGAGLPECAEVARLVRPVLQGMGLEPVPVTSGSKGIHLYAGLDGTHTSEDISAVAHELARALEADHPDLVVSDMKKTLRTGKVLIDWSQNSASKTTIAPYSLRGRPHPTVAVPRTWEELDDPGLRHLEFTEVLDLVRRRGDPMAAMYGQQALSTYSSMRDAGRTPEPVPDPLGPAGEQAGAGRAFVIQEHHATRLHWDLRLAHRGVLVSWAVPKNIPTDGTNHLAVHTEDHPMEYLTFSGTIPAGEYGGGEMTIWDTGTYEVEKWREGKEVIVTLTGQEDGGLAGPDGPGREAKVALIHTGGRGENDEKNWLIHLMEGSRVGRTVSGRDRRRTGSGTTGRARSHDAREVPRQDARPRSRGATSGADAAGAGVAGAGVAGAGARRPAPSPMLATAGEERDLLPDLDWSLEMKWDGVRAVVLLDEGAVRLVSRTGNDVTALYPELADVGACLRGVGSAVLDGEIVALDGRGRPSFSRLQQRFNHTREADIARGVRDAPVHLMLFDVLEVDGTSTVRETYDRRRELLRTVVDEDAHPRVAVPDAFDGDVDAALAASRRWGLEGVVAKRRDSRYAVGRRSRAWIKIKHTVTHDAVVIGWRPGRGNREGAVGSLLLAVPGEGGALSYAGRVGTGFSHDEAVRWRRELEERERSAAPVDDVPRLDARDARWVVPDRVAEVELASWTKDGRMWHPRWRGWRPDKTPADVDPRPGGPAASSPDRADA
ncbi:ATP-dependent DNA ligase [Georgenia alba]|uniref:DNA ligase (ATP) n=1 Tax=Georgenia alba TaxID=2233858 RepID=A0ABW2Q7R3_9MICO